MENLHDAWQELLAENERLLQELLISLKQERQALLTDRIDALREAALTKDKAARKLALLESQTQSLRAHSCRILNLPSHSSLRSIFDTLDLPRQQPLQRLRERLTTHTRSVQRLNRFNQSCIGTYLDQIDGFKNVLSLALGDAKTYNASGLAYRTGGKTSLLNRSI